MRISWETSLLFTAACLATMVSIAQATIICKSPSVAGQVFNDGDTIPLAIGSDNISPTVNDVADLTATFYCNTGEVVVPIKINPPNAPNMYKIALNPNATKPGGTKGLCLGNRYYISFSGLFPSVTGSGAFGPVTCPDIFIMPAPTPNLTTTTSTMSKPSSVTTTTASSTATTSSTTPLPSETPPKNEGGSEKISTVMIAVIVLATVLILVLVIVAIFFRRRHGRKKRMEITAPDMSSSTEPPNNNSSSITKISPYKEEKGDQSPSSGGASMKSQPKAPQLHYAGGDGKGGYFDEDSYAGYETRHPYGVYYEDPQAGYNKNNNNKRQPDRVYYEDPQDGYGNNPQEGYINNPQDDDYYGAYYGHSTAVAESAEKGYGYVTRGDPHGHYPGHNPQGLYPGSEGGHTFYKDSRNVSLASSPPALTPGRKGRQGRQGARVRAGAAAVEAAAAYYPPPPPVRGPTAVALRGPTSVTPPTPNYGQLDTGELILPDTFSAPVRSATVRAPQEIQPSPKRRPKSPRVRVDVTGIPMMPVPSNPHTLA
ncbi:hypothetical protein BGZ95_001374 [Linnemannia exigua]|uniref:Uncharacterized protein n=1 Tax=Linnemannia exigua TaxID=604196 RepID=A0AAD4D6Y7_9FUNG|nr:hypothetical protein BGZ95_001374 [Linnemannia exigua]